MNHPKLFGKNWYFIIRDWISGIEGKEQSFKQTYSSLDDEMGGDMVSNLCVNLFLIRCYLPCFSGNKTYQDNQL